MQKNRFRIICLCIIFTLCFSLVGCDLASGGILGELLDNLPSDLKDPSGELSSTLDRFTEETEQDPTPETGKPAPETKPGKDTAEPPMTEHPTTDAPVTEPPKTEPPTTEEPTTEAPIDPVTIVFSFDECDMWMNTDTDTTNSSNSVGNFFDPGCAAAWKKIADVDDYNVAYVRVWGWAAFYAEEVGQFGYQIDNNEPVFDDAFAIEAEQAVIDVSLSCGGKSGSRMCIMIPVRDLSGEHTIKALVRDAVGTVELITEFTLIKAVDPYAPVFFVPAADMASSMPGSPDIKDATMSSDGSYITITPGDVGDPYYQLPMVNGKGYVAKYVAIKYRTSSLFTYSEMFVGSGSGPCGAGDHIRFDLTCDGRWNLAIVDLSQATAVREGVINYLRWDCFAGRSEEPIDLAYIAAFDSAEAAQKYDQRFAGVYVDAYQVPQCTWRVSGHCPEIVPANGHSLSAIVEAGGIESGALLHQGSIYLGHFNLAQFSKMIIHYGVDNSQVTMDHWKSNANNRFMITNQDVNMVMSPEEEQIIASVEYTPTGWPMHTVEIDLTDVNYKSDTYVAWDTLPGTFMLIGAIELVYDPDYVEPEPIEPNAPIAIAYPDYLASMAQEGNHIHSVEIKEGGDYVTITATDYGDPYFYVLPSGGNISGVAYITVKYRVQDPNSTWGQFFVGSGQWPTGGPDELRFDYFPDGEWHVAILDLSVMESVNEQGLVNYLRYDFYSGWEISSIDLAEIIFFGSIEAAHAYYGI